MKRALWLLLVLLSLFFLVPAGRTVVAAPRQQYRFLSASQTSTLQEDINEAAAAGFRLVKAWASNHRLLALLVEDEAPDSWREYTLLAATRMSTLEKELNEAAADGFRLVPDCALRNPRISNFFGGSEVVVVLERRAAGPRFEYRVLGADVFANDEDPVDFEFEFEKESIARRSEPLPPFTGRVQSVQNDLTLLAREGYLLVGFVDRSSGRDEPIEDGDAIEHALIGERLVEAGGSSSEGGDPAEKYRVISASPDAGLVSSLSTAAEEGYRLAFGTSIDHLITLVMEKSLDPEDSYTYAALAAYPRMTEHIGSFEKRGYRVHPQGIFEAAYHEPRDNLVLSSPAVVIMERDASSNSAFEHRVSRASNSPLVDKIRQSSAEGYSLVGVATGSRSSLVVMSRLSDAPAIGVSSEESAPPGKIVRLSLYASEAEMEAQLNEMGALGYQAATALPDHSGAVQDADIRMAFEEGARDRYEYRVLATRRTSTMQRELNEAAADGFRLLPHGLAQRGGPEWVAILEKRPDEPRCEYLVLSTSRQSTMTKEIAEAEGHGFSLIGRLKQDSELVAFLERPESR
jgi:hypothetical protein